MLFAHPRGARSRTSVKGSSYGGPQGQWQRALCWFTRTSSEDKCRRLRACQRHVVCGDEWCPAPAPHLELCQERRSRTDGTKVAMDRARAAELAAGSPLTTWRSEQRGVGRRADGAALTCIGRPDASMGVTNWAALAPHNDGLREGVLWPVSHARSAPA